MVSLAQHQTGRTHLIAQHRWSIGSAYADLPTCSGHLATSFSLDPCFWMKGHMCYKLSTGSRRWKQGYIVTTCLLAVMLRLKWFALGCRFVARAGTVQCSVYRVPACEACIYGWKVTCSQLVHWQACWCETELQVANLLQEQGQCSAEYVEYPACGHVPMDERPNEFLQDLQRFVTEVTKKQQPTPDADSLTDGVDDAPLPLYPPSETAPIDSWNVSTAVTIVWNSGNS